MELSSVKALITGGASGLGAATASHLLAQGAQVTLLDLAPPTPDTGIEPHQAHLHFVAGDVTQEDAVARAVELAQTQMGGLNTLVNCAGVATPGRAVGKEGPLPLATFARVVEINLMGTFNAVRLAAAAMQANTPNAQGERGVIINTASVAAFEGQIGQAAYAASKGGVAAMTLPLAREMAQFGIRVCTIAPGLFNTPMMAGLPEEARQSLGHQVPFPPRLGEPSEYAQLAAHIVQNPMLNGETIRLDGAIRMAPR